MAVDPQLIRSRLNQYTIEHPRTPLSKRAGVRICGEFERIDALPRREWSEQQAEQLAHELTSVLRTSHGRQELRPIQAIALYEIAQTGGLVGPIRVGGGKTLITLLAPVVTGARRPLLLLPAKHVKKVRRELVASTMHWRVCTTLEIKSYEWISRHKGEAFLERYQPDMIVTDESHALRNLKASRTKKLIRYIRKHEPGFVALSGTLIRKRLLDWAHLSEAALKERSPAPRRWRTVAHWGNAVDIDATIQPGVLSRWCEQGETVREGFRRRVLQTPGVVGTSEGLLGVGLDITRWSIPLSDWFKGALDDLRNDWTLPDGYVITDPLHYYRAARQLALGVYYRYVVPPPVQWLDARREWSRFVRHCVRYMLRPDGGRYDSEQQVALACKRGDLDATTYNYWRNIRPTFKPETEHIWVTTEVVQALVNEAKPRTGHKPAIVWVESVAVGELMHRLGLTYYGAQGKSPDGMYILDADPRHPFAASIRSAGEGLNLQAWSRAIYTCPMSDAIQWEQSLGRIHRDGQDEDTCYIQVVLLGDAHEDCWKRAMRHAEYLWQITGQEQKLLQATIIDMPDHNDE